MAFPDLTLATPYVAQEAYKASLVKVLKIDDDTEGKSLRVFVQLGDNQSRHYGVFQKCVMTTCLPLWSQPNLAA